MAIDLNDYATGDTDYVPKMNEDNSDLENAVNLLQTDVESLKGAVKPGADLDFRLVATNLLINGGFNFWQRGIATRPDGWAIENDGGSFAVARSTAQTKLSLYSILTTNQGQLTQALTEEMRLALTSTFSLTFGAWVFTSGEDKARIGIYDGVTTSWSNFQGTVGEWEFLRKSYVQGSGAVPSEIKFVLDNVGSTVYFASAVVIRGNPNADPLFIANPPTTEELIVFSLVESGKHGVQGVGMLEDSNRVISTRVRFTAPKRSAPTIFLDSPSTGFEYTYENADRAGFDLNVAEIGGTSGSDGFDVRDIGWRAEV